MAALCGTAIHFPSIIYPSRSISLSSLLLPRLSSTNTTRLKAIGPSAEMLSATRISIQPPFHPTYDIKGIIKLALAEDSGDRGDVTCLATISHEVQAEASFLAKETGVIAGIAMADMIFEEVDPSLKTEWKVKDGDIVEKGTVFGTIFGSARSLLLAERVVLNFMQRMSGIATATKAMAEAARPARILETRKTAPGLRLLDKWAVLIGGGQNHRMGLYDMVLVKDNHIAVAGGIKGAVGAVNKYLMENKLEMGVEVETRTIDEVKELLAFINEEGGQVSRIMLDNMVAIRPDGEVDVAMLQEAVQLINGKVETEASGNVTINTVRKIGATGVTYISSGSLTHSVKALDISLNIDTELALAVGRRSNRA